MSAVRVPSPDAPHIRTFTGLLVNPLEIDPLDIDIADVAHALSMLCRFNGHVTEFYSVAQHSVLVSQLLTRTHALAQWGLLHDASEAYLGDVVRPLKRQLWMAPYRGAEQRVMRAIAERFNLSPIDEPEEVRVADNVLLETERRDLRNVATDYDDTKARPLPWTISPWTPQRAEMEFMAQFAYLFEDLT